MKLFRQSSFVALLCALVLGLTSAKVISVESKSEAATTATEAKPQESTVGTKATSNMSYSDLKKMAEGVKGEKLSLKEKIALKLFKKKIGNAMENSSASEKSQLIALILCALVGYLGIHRFYLGYTWQGIVQLLTAGGCGIWSLIDLIRIITGSLKPKNGDYDKTL